jgi:hypothetical protein
MGCALESLCVKDINSLVNGTEYELNALLMPCIRKYQILAKVDNNSLTNNLNSNLNNSSSSGSVTNNKTDGWMDGWMEKEV